LTATATAFTLVSSTLAFLASLGGDTADFRLTGLVAALVVLGVPSALALGGAGVLGRTGVALEPAAAP